jgi:hypothetical protein
MPFVILVVLVVGFSALTVVGGAWADIVIDALAIISPLVCIASLAVMWHPQDSDRAVVVFILAGFVTVASWAFCIFRGIIREATASRPRRPPYRSNRW